MFTQRDNVNISHQYTINKTGDTNRNYERFAEAC